MDAQVDVPKVGFMVGGVGMVKVSDDGEEI